jgi:2-polyprenyl-3-methyl-5-hydroxy-6-metoxy-1,4-benzoquinol methylase
VNAPLHLNYELKQIEIEVGDQRLQIECIRDLNQTIDDLFAVLEKNGNPALLEELCPYFGVVWASARALCDALFEIRSELSGASVLEVGCGLALPSLFCAMNGAVVTATDFHPEVPRFLKRNIELNRIQNLEYVSQNWNTSQAQGSSQFDWVIGSDIIYESQHPEPVARALVSRCKPGGHILLADPARPYLQRFSDAMKKLGFTEHTRIISVPDEPKAKEIFLLSFSR